MNDDVAQLQRRVQALEAQNAELKKHFLHQAKLSPDILSNLDLSSRLPSQNVGHASDPSFALSRSKSTMGYSSAPFMADQTQAPQAVQRRHRAMSQQTPVRAGGMANRPETAMPFRQTAHPVTSLEEVAMKRSSSSQSAFFHRSPNGSSPSLPQIQENDALMGVGMDPDVFIAKHAHEESYLDNTRTNVPPGNFSFGNHPSACPSMYSGYSVLEPTSPMTPQTSSFGRNSNTNYNWMSSVDMVNTSSSQSMYASQQSNPEALTLTHDGHDASMKDGSAEQELLTFGAGANLQSIPLQGCLSSFDSGLGLSTDSSAMKRSISNTSTSSCRSTASDKRLRERAEQVLQNSRKPILSKAREEVHEDLVTKMTKRSKAVSRRASNQRRKQPKIFCDHCNEYPDGFRGDHELQRHMNSKHSALVIRWICRDPDSLPANGIRPEVPLKGCKSCDSGKHYNIYYNAAAHLRRAHFVPRVVRGKGKGSRKEERRGGSAGGNWPRIEDLKYWYESVTVRGDSTTEDVNEPDDEDEEMKDTCDAQLKAESASFIQDVFDPTRHTDYSLGGGANANDVLANSGFISPMDVSPASTAPEFFLGAAGVPTMLQTDSSFTESDPSGWNSVTPNTYAPTFDYMTQETVSGPYPDFH